MDIACSIYPSSVDGHIDCFHHLSVICNVAMNIVYKFLCGHLFIFLGEIYIYAHIPRSRIS